MNIYQALNTTIFGGTVLALAAGLLKIAIPVHERPLTLWLFIAFFGLLRCKIFLDDHKYFGATETRNPHFKVGFLVGVASWFFWVLGGYSVSALNEAYFLVGVAISISTLWIIVVALRRGAYREQYFWIASNAAFVVLLWAVYRRDKPEGDLWTWVSLGVAISWVVVDIVASKSIPDLER